ncbi:MAG: twin-arginine translocase TatA/TatE family subunit [Actinobacteria bacterium]|nr:twin-arginine translocase TatA/TatE family subunit [Actinomycetota bacterium]
MSLPNFLAIALGGPELLIVLAIILLLFGSTRLPKLARSLGQASKEFKTGVKEGDVDITPENTVISGEAAKGSDPPPVDKNA